MKIIRFYYLLILLISTKVFSTGQVPDYLIIDNDTLKIHSNPLEPYFDKNPIPNNLITMRSTANWRGYIAYFKFVNNNLVVENIYKEEYRTKSDGRHEDFLTSIYKDVFGEKIDFPCDFYTGLLVCPYGEILEYVHMGYSSTYEFYKLFEVNSGVFIKSKEMTGNEYSSFKLEHYKYFKTTEDYKVEREKFQQMMNETDKMFAEEVEKKSKKKKSSSKENSYLKQKEAEYHQNKMLDSFMFQFLNNYIKTIDVPKKN
ncbi:hypothetical protein [Flavobacterium sp.]|uniref:hypothetical protein n=1 Tax=Flavobacterium sp. TaxID=239 RepID=UPI002B4B3D59|nr:hypothetical protein [Flavobacterium sp.]HLP63720.1 hypothetical protein [Flavobacterium sp.]